MDEFMIKDFPKRKENLFYKENKCPKAENIIICTLELDGLPRHFIIKISLKHLQKIVREPGL